MYFPVTIKIIQIEDKLDITIEKGIEAEFVITRAICSCGFMFKIPIIERSDTCFTYKSFYQTNYSGHHINNFKLSFVNGSAIVLSALEEFEGSQLELQHIFEFSLWDFTNFNSITHHYGYTCDYSQF
uniref:Putative nonstructural protein n=1 Tax=Hymenopteran phasma-related virus OKIAV234 TaxID=2792588 RepID=A0A7T0Q4S0_9VIRU|nr:putative nonstructural protein [Hymenopteran phasma-related virus OKIAV234]